MNVKLLVTLMTCAMVVNSQSTVSAEDLVQCDDLRSEIESIRQMLMTQKQVAGCKECQAIEEIKSQIKDIRDIAIQQQNQPRQECPLGFDYLPEAGRCFTLVVESMTWDNATERCRGIMPGVHLAAITSQEEDDAITKYLQSQLRKNNIRPAADNGWAYEVWIGGQRRNPGQCNDTFVWKTLKGIEIPFNYTKWNLGEPNCAQRESCVHIAPSSGHLWNDNKCHYLKLPLCEI